MKQMLGLDSPKTPKSASFYSPNRKLGSISCLLLSLRTCQCCRLNKLPSEIVHTRQGNFYSVRGPLQWCLQNLQYQGCTFKSCLACYRWLHCGRMGIQLCCHLQRIRSYWHHPSIRRRSEVDTECCVLSRWDQFYLELVTQLVSFLLLGPFTSNYQNM